MKISYGIRYLAWPLLLLMTACASERPVIQVRGNSAESLVLGTQGVDSNGVMKAPLPWIRFNLTAENQADCRANLIRVFGGEFRVRAPLLDFAGLGDFPALLVIDDITAPTVGQADASTAVQTIANLLPAKCFVAAGAGKPLDAALRATAALIVASLPRKANAELALTYGLAQDTAGGSIEITPGMRLKIQTSDFLGYQPNGKQRFYFGPTNYVYPGLRETDSGASSAWQLDLAASLADLGFNLVLPGEKPQVGADHTFSVGGIQDLRAAVDPGNSEKIAPMRYWRLYTPSTKFLPNNMPNSPYSDAESLEETFVLAAANKPGLLDRIHLTAVGCKKIDCFQFRSRGVVTPEIEIFVQGTPQWTWVGTRLGDILNQFRPLMRSSAAFVSADVDHMLHSEWARRTWPRLRLRRQTWRGQAEVVFNIDSASSAEAALSIPLIAGDAITW